MEELNIYTEELKIKNLLQKLKEKYCHPETFIKQNTLIHKSLYSTTNIHVSSFIALPIKNKSFTFVKNLTIVFDGWVSLPNNLNNVLDKNTFCFNTLMMENKKSNIKDKISYFESLNLESMKTQRETKKLIHSKPLVVDEKFRDLDYVLSIEKYKNKYVEERKQRFKLRSQIRRMLKDKESDNCLKPSEIIKEMGNGSFSDCENYNGKYFFD
ncbi:hypothetical protein TUBRATIS_001690 [Tubulinosema ratisbonensis]|uniref:Uncharacterized protein n=1 Tax=Tubulinosema ratisbonensis TaxID=291195 RepID=A0A437AQC5_9MICR|nr:hypothetical protein TUBRATIS_001690 [Tubulinosema ratisbonensis]